MEVIYDGEFTGKVISIKSTEENRERVKVSDCPNLFKITVTDTNLDSLEVNNLSHLKTLIVCNNVNLKISDEVRNNLTTLKVFKQDQNTEHYSIRNNCLVKFKKISKFLNAYNSDEFFKLDDDNLFYRDIICTSETVTELLLSETNIKRVDVKGCKNLTRLEIDDVSNLNTLRILYCENLNFLRLGDLSFNLNGEDNQNSELTNNVLQHFIMSNTNAVNFDLSVFKNIRSFKMNNCVTESTISIRDLEHLTSLSYHNNNINIIDIVGNLKNLSVLKLSGNNLTRINSSYPFRKRLSNFMLLEDNLQEVNLQFRENTSLAKLKINQNIRLPNNFIDVLKNSPKVLIYNEENKPIANAIEHLSSE